jgi:phage protein D
MSGATKSRRSTRFLVEFPKTESSALVVHSVRLRQTAYEHDICELEMHDSSFDKIGSIKTGEPVKVTWWQGESKREWLGYVISYEASENPLSANGYSVTAIGSSFVMKTRAPIKLQGKTVSQHASSLAKRNKMKFIGEVSSELAPSSTTGSKTHFEHLNDLAKKAGLVCIVENTNVIFQSFEKTLRDASGNVPIFMYFGTEMPRSDVGVDRTLDSYEVLSSEYHDTGLGLRNKKQVGGVDPITSKKFIETADPKNAGIKTRKNQNNSVFDEQVADAVAVSRSSAKSLAKGAAAMSRFTLPIKLLGQGDTRVRPHTLVFVAGTGKDTDGFWYVYKVTHYFRADGVYSTEIIALSDGLGSSSTFKNQSFTRNGDSVSGLLNLDAFFSSGLDGVSRTQKEVTVKLPGAGNRYVESNKLVGSSKVKIPTDRTVKNYSPSFREAPTTWRTGSPTKARTIG